MNGEEKKLNIRSIVRDVFFILTASLLVLSARRINPNDFQRISWLRLEAGYTFALYSYIVVYLWERFVGLKRILAAILLSCVFLAVFMAGMTLVFYSQNVEALSVMPIEEYVGRHIWLLVECFCFFTVGLIALQIMKINLLWRCESMKPRNWIIVLLGTITLILI